MAWVYYSIVSVSDLNGRIVMTSTLSNLVPVIPLLKCGELILKCGKPVTNTGSKFPNLDLETIDLGLETIESLSFNHRRDIWKTPEFYRSRLQGSAQYVETRWIVRHEGVKQN
jgi:hypothetical protein